MWLDLAGTPVWSANSYKIMLGAGGGDHWDTLSHPAQRPFPELEQNPVNWRSLERPPEASQPRVGDSARMGGGAIALWVLLKRKKGFYSSCGVPTPLPPAFCLCSHWAFCGTLAWAGSQSAHLLLVSDSLLPSCGLSHSAVLGTD